jgi:hypothetical protein
MYDTKLTNPKDVIGSTKLPVHLVPACMDAYAALAFLEGALKYGTANWRVVGVRASIYYSALQRHLQKWWNGEEEDPTTGVPHLASALACIGIILDARQLGKLTDDRPPSTNMGNLISSFDAKVKHLKGLFAEEAPRHYTIADSEPGVFAAAAKRVEEVAKRAEVVNAAIDEACELCPSCKTPTAIEEFGHHWCPNLSCDVVYVAHRDGRRG